MKKNIFYIIAITTALHSCEIDDLSGNTNDPRDKIEYTYKADDLKVERNALSVYYVDIVKHPEDSTRVLLYNFHLLGENNYITGTYNNNTISVLNSQTVDGFKVNGSGNVSSNYKTITWDYSVDYGDGTTDNYKATYTRVE